MSERLFIHEVAPRDGLPLEAHLLRTDDKVALSTRSRPAASRAARSLLCGRC